MTSHENAVVLASAIVTVAALGVVAAIESTVGFPGEWAVVVAFVLFVALGYALPQGYLLRVDESVSRVPRLGVVTLMLVVLAAVFSGTTSGTESRAILAIAGLSIVAVFLYEAREGYRASAASENA